MKKRSLRWYMRLSWGFVAASPSIPGGGGSNTAPTAAQKWIGTQPNKTKRPLS